MPDLADDEQPGEGFDVNPGKISLKEKIVKDFDNKSKKWPPDLTKKVVDELDKGLPPDISKAVKATAQKNKAEAAAKSKAAKEAAEAAAKSKAAKEAAGMTYPARKQVDAVMTSTEIEDLLESQKRLNNKRDVIKYDTKKTWEEKKILLKDFDEKKKIIEGKIVKYTSEKVDNVIYPSTPAGIKYNKKFGNSTSFVDFGAPEERALNRLNKMLHPDVVKNLPGDGEVKLTLLNGKYGGSYQSRTDSLMVSRYPTETTYEGPVIEHEYGHRLESLAPGAKEKANDFLQSRREGLPLEKLAGHPHDTGWNAGFRDTYTGKYYESGETEVVSTGVEQMAADPIGLYRDDPEHFFLILDILWGKP